MRLRTQPPPYLRPVDDGDWAERTRAMLTRDLLVRARHAQPGEARSLQFRALHLNLPLVSEVAERLGLGEAAREAAEHDAIGGLLDALRLFDPYGEQDFAWFAEPWVEQQMRAHLPPEPPAGLPRRRPLQMRSAVRRVALVIAGSHA